jgi:hypothetical protein
MTTPATTQSPYRMSFTAKFRPMETRVVSRRVVYEPLRIPWKAIGAFVVIGSCVANLVVFNAPRITSHGPPHRTQMALKALHAVAESWRANHANACPTLEILRAQNEIASSTKLFDEWGTSYVIRCTDDATTTVVSFGPDMKEGTADDITFPETK